MTWSERLAGIFAAGILVVAVALLLAPREGEGPQAKVMMVLAGQLTKLSAAVDATVAFENPPARLNDAELIELSTQYDPSLRTPFSDYSVRVFRGGNHAVVLVCDKSAAIALLEDAGCTAAMDRYRWKESAGPCSFSIDPASACAATR